MKKIIFLLMAIVGLQSCASTLGSVNVSGTNWTLTQWTDHTLPAKAQATLNFSTDNRVSGRAFCNTYGGGFALIGYNITFTQMFSTKMMCEDVIKYETDYLKDLEKVTSIRTENGKLMLYAGERLLMSFSRS
ncbi:META domain-containing protein [Pedobacter sp.]|uniref:META domain-containing protein n=1 Tax=Pedobacter sp. TaxID=1411316 RepID=UPI00396CD955